MILTADETSKIIYNIVDRMHGDKFTPQLIIGISRGGLMPAILISKIYDIPVIACNYSATDGKGDTKHQITHFPPIPDSNLNVLIVDDIADSGKTLEYVYNHYKTQTKTLKTCTVVHRYNSCFIPDYPGLYLNEVMGWVNFEYEIKDT